eukprot:1962681-Prorocentrum_lima.AAC.1
MWTWAENQFPGQGGGIELPVPGSFANFGTCTCRTQVLPHHVTCKRWLQWQSLGLMGDSHCRRSGDI